MTSTSGKSAKFCRAAEAKAGPSSTQIIRKPRRASGSVALPVAQPISNSRAPAFSPAIRYDVRETLDFMTAGSGDFKLTMDELRVVARYVAESAEEVLPVFEDAHPDDPRPRAALDAAWEFVNGARRTKLQRVTSLEAHRAAKEASNEAARLAARSAGDAASAAYLHPIAKAHQVGHILRAAASAARIAEINAGDDPEVGNQAIEQARQRATPVLIDVLHRYPLAPAAKNRVAQLITTLDTALRASDDVAPS